MSGPDSPLPGGGSGYDTPKCFSPLGTPADSPLDLEGRLEYEDASSSGEGTIRGFDDSDEHQEWMSSSDEEEVFEDAISSDSDQEEQPLFIARVSSHGSIAGLYNTA